VRGGDEIFLGYKGPGLATALRHIDKIPPDLEVIDKLNEE